MRIKMAYWINMIAYKYNLISTELQNLPNIVEFEMVDIKSKLFRE